MRKIYLIAAFILITSISRAQISLGVQDSIRMWPDSSHAPFIFGLTSGDPTDTSVIIWTAIPYDTTQATHTLYWQLAADSTFTTILQADSISINNSTAYAAKVDVQGLQAFTRYCYRFSEGSSYSAIGYTQTAPDSAHSADSLSFALVSCSSLYSGFFNAYRQIAENPGINAIIHVGDWIYDFIDPQERVRLPQPEPVEPVSLAQWRDRYRLYLLDPDLREARRHKPWIQVWDNHDVNKNNDSSINICTRAYWEFSPVRRPSTTDSLRIWRKVPYGPLADIMIIDDWVFAGDDTFPDGRKKMLPDEQYQWIINQMDSSKAIWKLVPMSKLFSHWELGPFTNSLPGSGLTHEWEGYPECRDSLLSNIQTQHINNSVFLSGDLHIYNIDDLALNPFDSTQYDGATGAGGLGVEVNGISVSRGNFDESGITAQGLEGASMNLNPQQRYLNLYDNGYAILTFNKDSLIARMMICPILAVTDSQRTGATLYCRTNDNHWLRFDTLPNGIKPISADNPIAAFPNPSLDGRWQLRADPSFIGAAISVVSDEGQLVYTTTVSGAKTPINMTDVPGGVYFLSVTGPTGTRYSTKLVRIGSYW